MEVGGWRGGNGGLGFVTRRKCGSGALYKLQLHGEVWKMSSANDVARNVPSSLYGSHGLNKYYAISDIPLHTRPKYVRRKEATF